MRATQFLGLGVGLVGAVLLATGCSATDGTSAGSSSPVTPTDDVVGSAAKPATEALDCQVAIVGGGVGGLHTAFRLAPSLGKGVCLFEREAQLGGRIKDISRDENDANAPRIAAGARRVMAGQTVLMGLAKELNLELEHPGDKADFLNVKKVYSFDKDEIQSEVFPAIPKVPVAGKDQETYLYELLLNGPERANVAKYPNLRSYVTKVVGEDGFQFLRAVSRFRADFDAPLDARGYMDYLQEEWDNVDPSYPKGGMSSFVRGMEAKAAAAGVRIFKSESVASLQGKSGAYEVRTGKHLVKARKLVVGLPPSALDKVEGDIAQRIKASAEYKQIIGIPVVTVAQFWEKSWWEGIKNPKAIENAQVWRAWSSEHCFNFIEIPQEPYAAAQHVTRSVYVDDLRCVEFWQDLAQKGTTAIEAEVDKGLNIMFNGHEGVTSPPKVTIPKPLKTYFQYWPAAWYWLRAGATITNAQLTDWAVEPLKGEDVGLVGEAYWTSRSGWSDGAYKSSIKLLNAKFGMKLAGLPSTAVSFASDSKAAPEALQRFQGLSSAMTLRTISGGVSQR